jgi:hypothetical protein
MSRRGAGAASPKAQRTGVLAYSAATRIAARAGRGSPWRGGDDQIVLHKGVQDGRRLCGYPLDGRLPSHDARHVNVGDGWADSCCGRDLALLHDADEC